jgi:hypothetical protein
LTVDAIRAEDQGAWLFVVNMDGAQVLLTGRKLGGVDSDLESARLAAQQGVQTTQQPPQALPPETQPPQQ